MEVMLSGGVTISKPLKGKRRGVGVREKRE